MSLADSGSPADSSGLADSRGMPVSTAQRGLIDELEAAHELSLSFRSDAVAEIDKTLRRNPDFVMGHCFKAGLLTQTMEPRIYEDMRASLVAAEALADQANDRERGHIAALRAWGWRFLWRGAALAGRSRGIPA